MAAFCVRQPHFSYGNTAQKTPSNLCTLYIDFTPKMWYNVFRVKGETPKLLTYPMEDFTMNGQIFTLVVFTEDHTIIVTKSKPYKQYRDSYLKAWVRRRLRELEEWGDIIKEFEVYKGESNDFADWYDLEPVYLDIS